MDKRNNLFFKSFIEKEELCSFFVAMDVVILILG